MIKMINKLKKKYNSMKLKLKNKKQNHFQTQIKIFKKEKFQNSIIEHMKCYKELIQNGI